jgi:hypothetical protein
MLALFIALTFVPSIIGWLGIEYPIVIVAADAVLAPLVIRPLKAGARRKAEGRYAGCI